MGETVYNVPLIFYDFYVYQILMVILLCCTLSVFMLLPWKHYCLNNKIKLKEGKKNFNIKQNK